MSRPQHRCNHAGCNIMIAYDKTYCTKHTKQVNKATYHRRVHSSSDYSKRQQFYKTTAWRKLSRQVLLDNPICIQCWNDNHVVRKADVVDHITEIKDDWSRRLDRTNLQPLCNYHHALKTKKEAQKRALSTKNS